MKKLISLIVVFSFILTTIGPGYAFSDSNRRTTLRAPNGVKLDEDVGAKEEKPYFRQNEKQQVNYCRESFKKYTGIKDSLLEALLKEDRIAAEEKINHLENLIQELGKKEISLPLLSEIILEELKGLEPVLARILVNRSLNEDVNIQGRIILNLLEEAGVSLTLARVIFDTLNRLPKKNVFTDDDLDKILLVVSQSLANELKVISHPNFSELMNATIDHLIDEVVTALYDDAPARKLWKEKLKQDILPYTLANLIPKQYFEEGIIFSQKRDYILGTILNLNMLMLADGSQIPELKKIFLTPNENKLAVRNILIHELTHHLGDSDQIKINPAWEFITYAVDLCEKIIWAKDGDIQAAEEEIELYTKEYVPKLEELYLRGKEIYREGKSVYILKCHQTEEFRGYFAIDLAVQEAIKLYEGLGVLTDSLRRYLNNQNSKLETPFEQEQFARDQYFAQKVSAIILAGIFIAEYEKNGIHPLRSVRDYFAELDQAIGPPNESDKIWIEQLIPEMERLGLSLFGRNTTLKPSAVTDRLGLWWCEEGEQWNVTVSYWPLTIYPRVKDDTNRLPHRKKARERAIGNLLLAFYRLMYTKDKSVEKRDLFKQPEFRLLWDTVLIPRAIFSGLTTTKRKVKSDATLGEYEEIPEMIGNVFKENYNLGSPRVEKEQFKSYPLHLQFLDSLLYRWSQYDGGKGMLNDPRLETNDLVESAARKASEAWTKLMFKARQYSNYEQIMEVVEKEIWPVYQELWKKDEEVERERRLIQELEERKKIEPGIFDPTNLTQVQKKFLNDLFNSLPQEMQEAIIKEAIQMVNASSLGAGTNAGAVKPRPISPAEAKELEQNLPQQLENIEKTVETMEKTLKDIARHADNIGDDANKIGRETPATGKELAEDDKAEEIQSKASGLQGKTKKLAQIGEQLADETEAAENAVFSTEKDLPIPELGRNAEKEACQLTADGKKIGERIEELQEKVNRLKKLADRLKEFKQGRADVSQLSEIGEAIKEETIKIQQSCQELGKATQSSGQSVEGLKEALDKLAGDVKKLEKFWDTIPKEQETSPAETAAPNTANQSPTLSAQTQLPPITLPARTDLTDLASIIKQAEKISAPATDKYKDRKFKTVVDPQWLEALKKEELLAECLRTGLNEAQLKEYKGWKNLLGKELLENMTAVVQALMIPQAGVENIPYQFSGILRKPIKAILGEAGFIKRIETKPQPVKVTLLIDISGSMTGKRILYAKLTMLALLEVIFEVNEELEKRGLPIIEFEIGVFNQDADPLISHETSAQLGIDKKEKLIYEAIKRLEAAGSTEDKKALGEFITRLDYSHEVPGSEGKARRILFSIGDGNVDEKDKEEIRGVLKYGEENDVAAFGVSVGDQEAMETVLNAYGEKRAILPQKPDLSDLPELVLRKFAECLAPPNYTISWEDVLSRLMVIPGLFGLSQLFQYTAPYLKEIFLKTTQNLELTEPPLRPAGYRHFFYQEINGRDYLVWQRPGKKAIKWQRGLGGVNVPTTITVDDDDNERLILEIISTACLPDKIYTSYSADGKYYLGSLKGEDKFFLMGREGTHDWSVKKEFIRIEETPVGKEEEGFKTFEKGELKWRLDAFKNLYLLTGEENWQPILGNNGNFSEYLDIEYDPSLEGYAIFDSYEQRLCIVKKHLLSDKLEVSYDLKMEKFSPAEKPENFVPRLIGYPGLGKDELIRAAAHLINEEVVFINGNRDLELEGLFEYPTIGVKQGLTGGHLYPGFNLVLHNGGWVMIDEIDELKPETQGALKSSIARNTHPRYVPDKQGLEKKEEFSNHPRARVFGSLNGLTISDPATQDRLSDIRFVWRNPDSEKQLQYRLALNKLKKLRPELSGEELEKEEERIRNIAERLVDIAWPMRLTYAGYDAGQTAELIKDNFKNWESLLKNPKFAPKSKPGKNLRRAPSPRTIANILEQAIMFPSTWENAPWSICQIWFNFWVDDLRAQEKENQMQTVRNLFQHPVMRGGADGIKDQENLPPVILTPDSFKVEGEYLVVTPLKVEIEGTSVDYWEAIKVWIHPEARGYIRHYGLPEEILYWISTADPDNCRTLYFTLQLRALGKNPILVGEQGSGKSELAFDTAELLDGPEVPLADINPYTSIEDLTFKQFVRGGVSGFNKGPVAVGVEEKKTVVFEETTQGKPGTLAGLNEFFERHFLSQIDGSKLGEEGDGRAGAIHALNPAGGEGFNVNPLREAFIERHPVLKMKPLSPEGMFNYILAVATRNGFSVNPRIIGEKAVDSSGNAATLANGEEKWNGLVGIIQYLREEYRKNPMNKDLPPRIPGLRAMKKLVKEIRDYWDVKEDFYPQKSQELFLEMFYKHFVMEGTPDKKAKWAEAIEKAFDYAHLYSTQKDALKEYLDGEAMIVQKLPLLRKPDSKDYQIDSLLIYLQENTKGKSVENRIDELGVRINKLKEDWEKLSFHERLQRMHTLREVWQILEIMATKRKGTRFDCYDDLNIDKMKAVQQTIQTIALDKEWPPSFIQRPEDFIDGKIETWDELKEKWGNLPTTGDLVVDDLLGKIAVNLDDENYLNSQIEKLTQIINPYSTELQSSKKQLYENIETANLLVQIRTVLNTIGKSEKLIELKNQIESGLNENGWGFVEKDLDKPEEAPLWKKYLIALQKGVQAKKQEEIAQAQKEAENIFAEAIKSSGWIYPTLPGGQTGETGVLPFEKERGESEEFIAESFKIAQDLIENIALRKPNDNRLFTVSVNREDSSGSKNQIRVRDDIRPDDGYDVYVPKGVSGIELLDFVLTNPFKGTTLSENTIKRIKVTLDELERKQAAQTGGKGKAKTGATTLQEAKSLLESLKASCIYDLRPSEPIEIEVLTAKEANEEIGEKDIVFRIDSRVVTGREWKVTCKIIIGEKVTGIELLQAVVSREDTIKSASETISAIIEQADKNKIQEKLDELKRQRKAKDKTKIPAGKNVSGTPRSDAIGETVNKDIEPIFNLLWGIQTIRAPQPMEARLNQLDEEFLQTLMGNWEGNYYHQIPAARTLIWIKKYLSQIEESLNEETTYQPQQCADVIKPYIDGIKNHFKTYRWPVDQKPEDQTVKLIGGKVDISVIYPAVGQDSGISPQKDLKLLKLSIPAKAQDIATLKQKLNTADWEQRHAAAFALSYIPTQESVNILWGRMLNEDDYNVLKAIRESLNFLRNKGITPSNLEAQDIATLEQKLNTRDWKQRHAAAFVLSYIPTQESVNILWGRMLNEDDGDVLNAIRESLNFLLAGGGVAADDRSLQEKVNFTAVPGLKLKQIETTDLKQKNLTNIIADREGNRFIGTETGVALIKPDGWLEIIEGTVDIQCQWIDLDKESNLYVLTKKNKLYLIPKNQQGDYEFTGREIKLPKVGQVELNLIPIKSFKISDDGNYIYINARITGTQIFRFDLKKEKGKVIIDEKTIKHQMFSKEQGQTMEIIGDGLYLPGMQYTGTGQTTSNGIWKINFERPSYGGFTNKIKGKDVSDLGSTLYLTKTVEGIIYVADEQNSKLYRLDTKADNLELEEVDYQLSFKRSFKLGNISFRIDQASQKLILGIIDSAKKCLREFEFLDANDQPIVAIPTTPQPEVPSVEGKDTDGNPCRIYVGDMVELETTAGNDEKYAIVSEIGATIKLGEIRCAFPYPKETKYAWYELPQVKKKSVSENNKVGKYKVGEKLLIRSDDSEKVFTAAVLPRMLDYFHLIALAKFEGTESKMETYNLDIIDQFVLARDWQKFDELTDDEKPTPMTDFDTEIKKMTDHQVLSYGGKIPDDYYVYVSENNIGYDRNDGSYGITIRKKSEKEIHYLYWVADIEPSDTELSKNHEVSGLKYLPSRFGKGGILYILSNDKIIDHTVGNFTVAWCSPEEYVQIMKERRGKVSVSVGKKKIIKPKLAETRRIIEVKSVNYAQLWKAFSEAVRKNAPLTPPSPARGEGKGNEELVSYQKLIAGIWVADSLEFVQPLQMFYLYLVAIGGGLSLGPEFKTAEIAEEIRKKLAGFKEEILAKIDKTGEEEIQKADFTRPLKVSKQKTKKLENVGMFIGLPVKLETVEVIWQAFSAIFSSVFSPAIVGNGYIRSLLDIIWERSRPFPTPAIQNHLTPVLKTPKENYLQRLIEKAA